MGIGIILVRVFTLAYGFLPEVYLEDVAHRLGALLGDVIVFALAVWLIYTGRRPAKVNLPKD